MTITITEELASISHTQEKKIFQKYAESGILRHGISRSEGGYGDSFFQLCQAYRKLGFDTIDTGLILSLQAHVWGVLFPLIKFGSQTQKKTFLEPLLCGQLIGGHAITEPSAGSDISAMKTTYTKIDKGYLISGHKRFITNAPIADLLIVYARNDQAISAFIVLNNSPSVKFLNGPCPEGFCSAPMGDILLDNCFVPEELCIGPIEAGGAMIQSSLELERAFLFSGILGVMQWQMETVIQYCRSRIVNGVLLGTKQVISHKIADMATRLDTVKLWIEHCARLKDENKRIGDASAKAKLFASEAFLASSLDAVHILGAFGLIKEQKMIQLVQDAMAGKLLSGSSEVQKNIIAGLLGLGE